jgi:hypothetical protein
MKITMKAQLSSTIIALTAERRLQQLQRIHELEQTFSIIERILNQSI